MNTIGTVIAGTEYYAVVIPGYSPGLIVGSLKGLPENGVMAQPSRPTL